VFAALFGVGERRSKRFVRIHRSRGSIVRPSGGHSFPTKRRAGRRILRRMAEVSSTAFVIAVNLHLVYDEGRDVFAHRDGFGGGISQAWRATSLAALTCNIRTTGILL
jgi:hypothetical protein